MILGLFSEPAFTTLHVAISLLAIVSGLFVFVGMATSKRLPALTALFLVTTVLTSVTGFLFPIKQFTPALGTGIVSMIVLAVALYALYGKQLAASWRAIYIATAAAALWFNVLVLIIQTFQKISFAKALAPTQSEPPFLIAQAIGLAIVALLAVVAAYRFRPFAPPV